MGLSAYEVSASSYGVCSVLLRAEAGTRPGGRPPFLCATRKEAKKRAPQSAAPSGQTCVGVLAGCAVELTARCALRSDNHGESVHEAGVSFGTPATPQAPRRRRSQKGWGRVGFHGAPRKCSAAGCPCAPRGGRSQQGRLLFGDFLLAKQEKVTAPPGAHPGLRPPKKHLVNYQKYSCWRLSDKR